MSIYYIFLFIFGTLALLNVRSKVLFLIAVMFLSFFSAIRSYVGSDYKKYYGVYVNFPHDQFTEPFFNWIIVTFKSFDLPPQSLFIFCSVITFFFLSKAITNTKVSIFFSLFLFIVLRYYFDSFNIMRQFIVIAIMLYGVKFISERKPLNYFTLAFLCSFIHLSAILYIPFYFILHKKYRKELWFSLILISILSVKINIIPDFLIPDFYKQYINTNHFSKSDFSGFGLGFIMSNLIAIVLVCYYKHFYKSKIILPYVNMYFIGIIMQNLSFQAIIFRRVSVALLIAQIIVIPYFISLIKGKYNRLFVLLILIIYYLLVFSRGLEIDSSYLEYKSIFN